MSVGPIAVYLWHFGSSSHWRLSDSERSWAEFGEYFGGLSTPALTLLGMLLVALGLYLQVHQLKALHRDTLAAARRWDDQRKEFQRDFFQGHFFRTLEIHTRLVESASAATHATQDIFHIALEFVGTRARNRPIPDAYRQYRSAEGAPLVRPLQAAFSLIKLTERCPGDDQDLYLHLLNSALSDDELILLSHEAQLSGTSQQLMSSCVSVRVQQALDARPQHKS